MSLCYSANKKAITSITANDGTKTRKISAVWGNIAGQKTKLWESSSNGGNYLLATMRDGSTRLSLYKYGKSGFAKQQAYGNIAFGDESSSITYKIYILPDGQHFVACRYNNSSCQSSGLFVFNKDLTISTITKQIYSGNSEYAEYAGQLFFISGDLNYWFYIKNAYGSYTNTMAIEKLSENAELGLITFPNGYTGIRYIKAYDMDNHFVCFLKKSNGNECIAIVQFPTIPAQFRVLSSIDLATDYKANDENPISMSADRKYISVNRGGIYKSDSPFEITNVFMLLKVTNLSLSRVVISSSTAAMDIYPVRKCCAVGVSNDDTKLVALITDADTGLGGTSLVRFDLISPNEIKPISGVKTLLDAPCDVVSLTFSPKDSDVLYIDSNGDRIYDIPLQSISVGQRLDPQMDLYVNGQAQWITIGG